MARGDAQYLLGQYAQALAFYDRALALQPDFADAHVHRGMALKALGRPADAVAAYDYALAIRPGEPVALNNRGNALVEAGQATRALESFEQALRAAPEFVEAHYGRGNALHALRRFEEALASFDRALQLRPAFAEAHCNRGYALSELRRHDEALAHYDRALALKPTLAEAYLNRGMALAELKRPGEAIDAFSRALLLNPRLPTARGLELYARMKTCNWSGFDERKAALARDLEAGICASPPFPVLGLIDSPALQRTAAELYIARADASEPKAPPPPRRSRSEKIRIGYFSSDFYDHACAYLMMGLFEQHDRDRFEIHAFSFGPDRQDDMRRRIVAAVDAFHDIDGLSDKQAALAARELGIDIAIDRNGHTATARPGISAHRAAPIQVNYLGYPGTTGAEGVDYIIADAVVIPRGAEADYSEKVVRLPHSYQPSDDKRLISDRRFTRAECGLPETGFVFCCFNNNYKITPDVFDVWMRVLGRVDGAVLWLLEDNPEAARRLRAEARRRGVDAARLVFAPRMPVADHLARHRLADLFLDTRPYNAHTTASDALWAGLPVLTCMGESFAARVAASLLHAVGLPELVTSDLAPFEHRAVDLAHDPDALAALRQKLADNRLTTPLFDTKLYARHLEAAFATMAARARAGETPQAFDVPA